MKRAWLAAGLVVALVRHGVAQSPCQIDEAAREYAAGNFDQAQQTITACLAGRPKDGERIQAYALRAKISLAIDDTDAAQQSVTALLGLMPDFAPSFDDPPRFARMVGQLKRELARNTTSSVSKINENVLEAPATVVVVTGEQIRRRGYVDVEEVLHDLPGFDISRSNGTSYSNAYQRGYRSDTTNRTLFLVDGVEQNDLYSNTAHISRQYPLSNIDRIEVVYGPASTMYGANAYLGVINIITKDPDEIIGEGKVVGVDAQVGGGSWKTGFFDGTIAGRFRDATISFTGRVYNSNEWDLSRYGNWKYDAGFFDSEIAKVEDQYDRYLFGSGIGQLWQQLIGPSRFLGLYSPASSDQKAFTAVVNGNPLAYSDITDDWMLSGKLKFRNFTVGMQAWQRKEGAASEGTDFEVPGADNGNVWIPRETSFFVRYAEPLTGNLSFTYFGQAKVHSVEAGSSLFSLNAYLNGPLDINDLLDLDGTNPVPNESLPAFWSQTLIRQSSNQIRNELNLVFRHANTFNIVGGLDLRNGSIQADYVKSTDCTPKPQLFSDSSGLPSGYSLDQVLRVEQLLTLARDQPNGGLWVRCTPTNLPPATPKTGGDHFAVTDVGTFAQASFRWHPAIKIVAGGRIDHDEVSEGSGFGTVFTPRLSIVYSPRWFVAKAIYAEAFKDPSNFEKFTQLPGVLDLPNRSLEPERARNLEMSLGGRWERLTANVALYRTNYSNLVTLAPDTLVSDPQIRQFLDGAAPQLLPLINVDSINKFFFESVPAIEAKLPVLLANFLNGQPADHSGAFLNRLFNDPIFTYRFQNLGALRVFGVQADASYRYGNTDLFGNYTYTNPLFTQATNEAVASGRTPSDRVGDIASHHVNLGVQQRWRKLDMSLRANFVSARPTVLSNPLAEVPRYAVANAAVSYVDFLPGLTAQLLINNIFDTQYSDPGIRTADNIRFASSVPQPGRSFFVKLLTHNLF